MRAQATFSVLLLCQALAGRSVGANANAHDPNRQAQEASSSSSPYVCDGSVYNESLLPVVDLNDPFLSQRGNLSEGYPRVWMSANSSQLIVNTDCSFQYSDPGVTSRSLLYYNASLFNISGPYTVAAKVNITQLAESQGGTGLVLWMRGEGQNVWRSVSLLYLPDKEDAGVHGKFHVLTLISQRYSVVHTIDRSCDCRLPAAQDNQLASMQAFVEPMSGVFTLVCGAGKATVVRRLDLSHMTEGRDTEFVGLETHTARASVISPLVAHPWDPATTAAPPLTAVVPCPNYMKEVVLFLVLLSGMLFLIVLQIKWAHTHARSNYTQDNQPRVLELVASGIAGLQYFSLIGQAAYLHISILASDGEEDLAKFGNNRYSRFLMWTVGFLVFDTLYNGAVAWGAIWAYRDRLKDELLRRHWLAYSLLSLMSLTNLELLTLFPWDYERFPLASQLDGYPTPIVAQLSSLPTVLQNVPVLVIQVLTEGCQPPTQLAATDLILWVILTITITDTISHFALQLLPTLEAEKRYRETLPLESVSDRRGQFQRLRSTISASDFNEPPLRQNSGRRINGWGQRWLRFFGLCKDPPPVRSAEEEEEEEEEKDELRRGDGRWGQQEEGEGSVGDGDVMGSTSESALEVEASKKLGDSVGNREVAVAMPTVPVEEAKATAAHTPRHEAREALQALP